MIIYLDQNKWIELAKTFYGKDKSPRAGNIKKEFTAAINSGAILPLSAIHYMELANISNDGRRARLGEVMWTFSKGYTIASYRELIRQEIEVGLGTIFPSIAPRKIKLIGRGSEHAFGENYSSYKLPEPFNELFEKSLLTGNATLNIPPIKSPQHQHEQRSNFLSHLKSIHETKKLLEKRKWENWLYAIAITDILKPLAEVCQSHGISKEAFEGLSEDQYKKFVDAMPTRRLDVHLHRQVLKNPKYSPKISDLEDWSGIGVASCYCDVVVCEKHFADMLGREKYSSHARIETNLNNVFRDVYPFNGEREK